MRARAHGVGLLPDGDNGSVRGPGSPSFRSNRWVPPGGSYRCRNPASRKRAAGLHRYGIRFGAPCEIEEQRDAVVELPLIQGSGRRAP